MKGCSFSGWSYAGQDICLCLLLANSLYYKTIVEFYKSAEGSLFQAGQLVLVLIGTQSLVLLSFANSDRKHCLHR